MENDSNISLFIMKGGSVLTSSCLYESIDTVKWTWNILGWMSIFLCIAPHLIDQLDTLEGTVKLEDDKTIDECQEAVDKKEEGDGGAHET